VVVVREYYYNDNTKGIKKRSNKRKICEASLRKRFFDKVISWRLGPYPQVNALENA
jgi:hypothetical protein